MTVNSVDTIFYSIRSGNSTNPDEFTPSNKPKAAICLLQMAALPVTGLYFAYFSTSCFSMLTSGISYLLPLSSPYWKIAMPHLVSITCS